MRPRVAALVVAVALFACHDRDPRLRRPYLVELSTSAPRAADDLAAYLRSPDIQQWIATFGRGTYGDQPLFFPVANTP